MRPSGRRLFIFILRESKWGTLQSAGNPRCAVPAEIHSICTDRPRPGPPAGLQVSPTSDTSQSVAILMNRPHSSGIYFRQTPVGSRLLCSRSIVALLIVVYFYIHGRTFLNPNFRFVKKLVRNLLESKSCFDESDEINIQTKISFNKVHDEEEDEDDDDETIKKKGLKEPGLW